MSQISLSAARDLLSKLLSERIPLRALFVSPSGVRSLMPGFVDSISQHNGLGISESGPPIDVTRAFFNLRPLIECTFWYGERRELAEEIRASLPVGSDDESALSIRLPQSEEVLTLFFTI
jgi:hypothetical protein